MIQNCQLKKPVRRDVLCALRQWDASYAQATRGNVGVLRPCLTCPEGKKAMARQKRTWRKRQKRLQLRAARHGFSFDRGVMTEAVALALEEAS